MRKLAEDFNLPTRHRKDSQGICFLGKLKFEDFIGHYLGKDLGPIKDYVTGTVNYDRLYFTPYASSRQGSFVSFLSIYRM